MLGPLMALGALGRVAVYTPVVGNGLRSGLVAYWPLDEASGNRLDSTAGAYHLAPTGGPGNAAGKIGQACVFDGGTLYLAQGTGAPWHLGGGSFTLAGWVWFDDLTAYRPLITKDSITAGNREYNLISDNANAQKLTFTVFDSSGALVQARDPTVPSTGTWYHVAAWYDAGAGTINISVNNNTPTSTALGGLVPNVTGTAAFILGHYDSFNLWHSGRLDEWGVWSRALSGAQRTALYNAGAGLNYAGFS